MGAGPGIMRGSSVKGNIGSMDERPGLGCASSAQSRDRQIEARVEVSVASDTLLSQASVTL
jgi:hypothetical protein